MSRRRLLVALACMAAVVSVAGPAWAFFGITTSSVSPTVSAYTMTAPTSVAVTSIGGTATLTWTAPTTPSGASFTYTIARTVGTGTEGGTCAAGVSTTTCQDTAATAGQSYTWTITAHLGAWNSPTGAVTATAAGPVHNLSVSSATSVTAGTAFNVTVTAKDSLGDNVTGYTGTVAFSLGVADSGASGLGNHTFTSGGSGSDNGQHVFSATLTKAVASGGQSITATDSGNSVTGSQTGITVTAGSPTQIVAISGGGQSATVAETFTNPLVAEVEDQYGNAVSGQTVNFSGPAQTGASATFLVNPSPTCNNTGGVSATSCSATTGSNGQATSSTVTANANTGSYNVTAMSGAFSVNFSLSNGPAVYYATPAVLTQGAAAQTVTITGTGFVSGSSLAVSITGTSGITTSSPSVTNSRTVTVHVTVPAGQTVGNTYGIQVTNGNGTVGSCSNCFAVNKSASSTPSVALTFPVNGDSYSTSGNSTGSWRNSDSCGSGSGSNPICGTASTTSGSVSSVSVTVIDEGNNECWGGTSFNTTCDSWTAASGTTSWNLPWVQGNFTNTSPVTYLVIARVVDSNGNTGYVVATVTIT